MPRSWTLYADVADPQIAEMVAQAAGNVRYDEIEQQRAALTSGKSVPVETWHESVKTLIKESPDVQTVQYLSAAALELEAIGHREHVIVTLKSLSDHFDDPATATGKQVEVAIAARQARQQIIGRTFSPGLLGVDQRPLSMNDYRGKIVLMPFWAAQFPESLQLVPFLENIQQKHPRSVAIVGMNLDPHDVAVAEFVRANELSFPSYRSVTSPGDGGAQSVASQFGLVSMPFVAVLDGKGRVAAISLQGHQLENTVNELLQAR